MYSSLVVLLIIWVSRECKVSALRIFPAVEEDTESILEANKNQTDIFHKYFNDTVVSDLNNASNGTFLDYKRRIPSSPDPLHNK